ncbi:MAG: tail fiber domain-containing protein, partial [Patescibacteria group bacterium]
DTTPFIIDQAGNVGIGTSSPAKTLSVAGTGYFTGNVGIGGVSANAGLEVYGTTLKPGVAWGTGAAYLNSNDSMAINLGGTLAFGGNYTGTTNTDWAAIVGWKENATDSNTSGYLGFYTKANAGSQTEKVRITSAGNVGIGTTTPQSKLSIVQSALTYANGLTIYGSGGTDSLQLFGSNDNVATIQATQDGNVTGSNLLLNPSGGSVGIGTTGPLSQLSVGGVGVANVGIYGTGVDAGLYGVGTASGAFKYGVYGSGSYGIGGNGTLIGVFGQPFSGSGGTGGYFTNNGAGTYGLLVASGNVGIGDTTPANALSVVGTTTVSSKVLVTAGCTQAQMSAYPFVMAASDSNDVAGIYMYATNVMTLDTRQDCGTAAADLYLNPTATQNHVFTVGGTIASISDQRLKTNVTPITGALEKLTQLRPVSYQWINPALHGSATSSGGFIAQEVQNVFPQFVTTTGCAGADCTLVGGDGSMQYAVGLGQEFNGYVVGAIQELNTKVDANASSTAVAIGQVVVAVSPIASSTAANLVISAPTVTMTQAATTTVPAVDGAWAIATSTASGTTPIISISAPSTGSGQAAPQTSVSINAAHVYINGQELSAAVGDALIGTSTTSTIDTTSTTDTSYAARFFGALTAKLTAWLGSAGNGIADLFAAHIHAQVIDADRVNTQTLCIGATCVTESQLQALLSGQVSSSTSPVATQSTASTVPVLSVNGNNPTSIAVGASYIDLGATITGPSSALNLGVYASVDGGATTSVSGIQIDTSAGGTHYVRYFAIDQDGLMGEATRTVIVGTGTTSTIDTTSTTDTTTTASSTPTTTDTTTDTTASSTPVVVDTTTDTASSTTATSTTP